MLKKIEFNYEEYPVEIYMFDNLIEYERTILKEDVEYCASKGLDLKKYFSNHLLGYVLEIGEILGKIKDLFDCRNLVVIKCEEEIYIYDLYNGLLHEIDLSENKISNTFHVSQNEDVKEYVEFMETAIQLCVDEKVMDEFDGCLDCFKLF